MLLPLLLILLHGTIAVDLPSAAVAAATAAHVPPAPPAPPAAAVADPPTHFPAASVSAPSPGGYTTE